MTSAPVQLPLSAAAKSVAAPKINPGNTANITTASSATEWTPTSWHSKPMKQNVAYTDLAAAERALQKLKSLPPLVTPAEINRLRASLKEVALGKAFLLQGGDCAELFDYCTASQLDAKIKLLLQMSLVLIWGGNIPVVRIARMAGQFAKPRSSLTEVVDGKEIPSFRGDNINGFAHDQRTPDPNRLVDSYFHSAATLNYVRAQLASGFADLHYPFEWTLNHVQDDDTKKQYQATVDSITDAIRFLKTIGADNSSSLGSVDLYTSHEGMVLDYEESLTRQFKDPRDGGRKKWYNTSAHFLWIGDRTRQLDAAHVEYFRGIENPIGIKVGPSMQDEELVNLLDIVNPNKEIGKITLITRYGCDKVAELLPGHIKAVAKSGHLVIWQCDPMHGNTRSSEGGVKTRQFSSIISELATALSVHEANRSRLGGVHLELTGEPVTECVGGSQGLTDKDLSLNYTTYCDPRLNNKQALEAAFLIAGYYREGKMGGV